MNILITGTSGSLELPLWDQPQADHRGLRSYISSLIARNGPEPSDYGELDNWYRLVAELEASRKITKSDVVKLREDFGEAMTAKTLQGFACSKPHGYAGDFEIIDRIYQNHVSPDPCLAKWDYYFHSHAAPRAVRNRKDYFHSLLDKLRAPNPRILKIGVGPGRSMFEWLTRNPSHSVSFDCVDSDNKAVEYAKKLNSRFLGNISFYKQNCLRFHPDTKYDLIWAAGVFDYFTDKLFIAAMKRLYGFLVRGGELVIGNFSPKNPTRAYMEFSGWNLQYRSEENLLTLASDCGLSRSPIRIDSEPEGINLFMHVTSRK